MSAMNNRANSRGFTLIELLVVLAILGLLAGLVGPQVMKHFGEGKVKTAKLQIKELESSLDIYKLEVGSYPTTEQGLNALVQAPAGVKGWNGPYIKKGMVPLDPWNNPYHYKRPGTRGPFDLFSYGGDNAPGGDGENVDITNWD